MASLIPSKASLVLFFASAAATLVVACIAHRGSAAQRARSDEDFEQHLATIEPMLPGITHGIPAVPHPRVGGGRAR